MIALGKRLLVFSPRDERAATLVAATADWGCLVTICGTADELRGRIEGGGFDLVLVEDSTHLRKLIEEADPGGDILQTPLATVEKRHILRVLAATNNNKTRAAKILGIDTKTLYNKLKSYSASADAARRRAAGGQSGEA